VVEGAVVDSVPVGAVAVALPLVRLLAPPLLATPEVPGLVRLLTLAMASLPGPPAVAGADC